MGSVQAEREYMAKAKHDMLLARKKLKGFALPTAPNVRNEEACEFYNSAARRFRIASRWQDSAECYAKCADLQTRMGAVGEAAFYSLEAATCYERQDPAEAIVFMRNAISLYCELGRFGTAANIQMEVAELYETDRNWEETLAAYRQASDYFMGADMKDKADQCLYHVAMISATLEQFEAAVPIFERLATNALKSNLLKFNAPDFLLRAALCLLADGEKELLEDKLNEWCEQDATFMTTREFIFLCDLLECLQSDPPSLEIFVRHCYNFDNVLPFDAWGLKLLRRVKEAIDERVKDIAEAEERARIREEREKQKAKLEEERFKRMQKLMKLQKGR